MEEVRRGIKTKGWHLGLTDKSRRIVLATKDKYMEAIKKHTVRDPIVSMEDVTAGEEEIYDTTTLLISIFGMGKDKEDQPDLIAQALKPVQCGVTPMLGQWKDHKAGWDFQ